MASAMRKMAVYLGLVEDDHRYDELTTTVITSPSTPIRPARRRRTTGTWLTTVVAGPTSARLPIAFTLTWPGSRHCTRARTTRHGQ